MKNKPIRYYDSESDKLLEYNEEEKCWGPQRFELEGGETFSTKQIKSGRFIPIYPREVQKTLTMEFTDEQLGVVYKALEAYSRFRIGQFGTGFEAVFNTWLDLDDKNLIDEFLRRFYFKDKEELKQPNTSFGIYSLEAGDGTLAFHISKVIDEYRSVKNNHGYWGTHRGFDGALYNDNVPKTNFENYIDYTIDDPITCEELNGYYENEQYDKIWNIFDKAFPFVHSGDMKIERNYVGDGFGGLIRYTFALRVTRPKMEMRNNNKYEICWVLPRLN